MDSFVSKPRRRPKRLRANLYLKNNDATGTYRLVDLSLTQDGNTTTTLTEAGTIVESQRNSAQLGALLLSLQTAPALGADLPSKLAGAAPSPSPEPAPLDVPADAKADLASKLTTLETDFATADAAASAALAFDPRAGRASLLLARGAA